MSLNSILLKGPDVLNPIRVVLLRLQEGEHAAIRDITKMYNSVWLEEQEVHVDLFKEYTRLNNIKFHRSTLITREAHGANHEGVVGTLLHMRSKAWVVQGPRITRNVIDSSVHCRKTKAMMCKQVMGEPILK